MYLLSKFYIFLYFFYSYFGYNFVNRILINKRIDYALIHHRGYAFIGKRICMLSHIAFLYSAYFLENPNFNNYINLIFLHSVVNIGYYLKWGTNEITTFLFHIIWAMPVSIYGFILIKNYNFDYYYNNIFMLNFLIFYLSIFNKIYTQRIPGIDNAA